MSRLDPEVLPLEGTRLVEASAGTGKTHTLTTLYLRLLVEYDLVPSQILLVTFTNAATAELGERVRARIREAIAIGDGRVAEGDSEAGSPDPVLVRLTEQAQARALAEDGENPLRRALREFDEAAISTIHGFCQRTLTRYASLCGVALDIELAQADGPLAAALARDLWASALDTIDAGFVHWLLEGDGRRWKFEPDELLRDLIRPAIADPDMPILPEAEQGDVAVRAPSRADLDAASTALRAWGEAWPDARPRIESWLLDDKALNRRTYARAKLETHWLPKLDALSARVREDGANLEVVLADVPDFFSKLATDGLIVNAGSEQLADPIFDAFGRVCKSLESIDSAREAAALGLRRLLVERARAAARRRREEQHVFVFDDLLIAMRDALRGPSGARLAALLRQAHPFALIDEFQDTDPVQYEIFRRIWDAPEATEAATGLVLVGDPKQAIYSFRGADVFTYLTARRRAADGRQTLGTNWRSTPALVAVQNALFGTPDAFASSEIDHVAIEPRVDPPVALDAEGRSTAGLRVLLAARPASEDPEKPAAALPLRFGRTNVVRAVVADIAQLLDCGGQIEGRRVAPGDVAVLCHAKAQLARIREGLEERGIPCVDRGDADVFESREARELAAVMEAMLRPGDAGRLRAALATAAHGGTATTARAAVDSPDELSEHVDRYAEYGRLWARFGFMRAFEAWRRQEQVTPRLLQWVDGERRATNWLHLAELLQKREVDASLSPEALTSWLRQALESESVREPLGREASVLRLERDDAAVSLVTLHASKGLEYEIVYLPFLWEMSPKVPERNRPVRFHDAERDRRVIDLGGPDLAKHAAAQHAESESELLRLLYVGITRARRQCVIPWAAIGSGYVNSPLARLLQGLVDGAADPDAETRKGTLKGWSDVDWRKAWEALAEAAGPGAVSIETLEDGDDVRWRPDREAAPHLVFEPPRRVLGPAQITTSFSGLAAGALATPSTGPEVVGRDLDQGVALEVTPNLADEGESGPSDLASGLDAFPRGAAAGTMIHEVLEEVDYSDWEGDRVLASAEAGLARTGLPESHAETVVRMVDALARTELPAGERVLKLGDVAPADWQPELEFTLAAPGPEASRAVDLQRLAGLLAESPEGTPARHYAVRARRLEPRRFQGFLRGFIDAVFSDGERYYLLDYKSNHLGPRQADYRPERLLPALIEHDYVLQYLLYSVALDRMLRLHLSDYDPARHFGGALYLFVRGISPAHAPGCGVFFDRPDPDTIARLSGWLGER